MPRSLRNLASEPAPSTIAENHESPHCTPALQIHGHGASVLLSELTPTGHFSFGKCEHYRPAWDWGVDHSGRWPDRRSGRPLLHHVTTARKNLEVHPRTRLSTIGKG